MRPQARLLLAALLVAGVAAAAARSREILEDAGVQASVAGGEDALINRFRWMVSLRYSEGPLKGDPICGGILIANNTLLTAASCVLPRWNIPRDATLFPWARIGVYPRRGGEYELRFITATLLHARFNYSADPALNDIALMRLGGGKIPVVPSLMTPIKLPPRGWSPPAKPNSWLTVLGFGDWGKPNVPKFLQQAMVRLKSQAFCKRLFPKLGGLFTSYKHLCTTGGGGPQGMCAGDYGGPLFVAGANVKEDLLVGLSTYSGGKGCGSGISGYLNVAAYRAWIDKGVRILSGKEAAGPSYRAFYLVPEPDPIRP